MNDVSFNPNFKGRFINPEEIRKAAKVSENRYYAIAKEYDYKIDSQKVAGFTSRAEELIKYIEDLAAKLPDEVDLVLSKLKGPDRRKRYSLDVIYNKLGKSEFMRTPGKYKWVNCPEDNFTREFDLETAERTVAPLKVRPYTFDDFRELWSYSDIPVEKRIINKYILFIRKEVLNLIYHNKIKSAEKKANELAIFAQKCGYNAERMDAELKWFLENPQYVKEHDFVYL